MIWWNNDEGGGEVEVKVHDGGVAFDRAGHLLVSGAALSTGQSGATFYDVARGGTVTADGPAVPIDQAAACWLAAAGRFAYTASTGRGNIGRYAVAPDGTLTALGSTLIENDPKSSPHEEGVSARQNYLHVLANGLSQIVGHRVGADGSLTQVTTAPVAAGSIGVGANCGHRPQLTAARRMREAQVLPHPAGIRAGFSRMPDLTMCRWVAAGRLAGEQSSRLAPTPRACPLEPPAPRPARRL